MFSNVQSVLSQCNAWLRLLHLLYDIEVMQQKTIKDAFSMFYTVIFFIGDTEKLEIPALKPKCHCFQPIAFQCCIIIGKLILQENIIFFRELEMQCSG